MGFWAHRNHGIPLGCTLLPMLCLYCVGVSRGGALHRNVKVHGRARV